LDFDLEKQRLQPTIQNKNRLFALPNSAIFETINRSLMYSFFMEIILSWIIDRKLSNFQQKMIKSQASAIIVTADRQSRCLALEMKLEY
jgi:hypothetical protein